MDASELEHFLNSETTDVFVCVNVDCKSRGAEAVLEGFKEKLAAADLKTIDVRPYLCFSACNIGPNVVIASKRCWYSGVHPTDIGAFIGYLQGGNDIPRLKEKNDADLEQMIFDIIDAGLVPDAV